MSEGTEQLVRLELKADLIRSDLIRGLVWFVNYAALDPTGIRREQLDLHGTGMLPQDVELLAHRFLLYSRTIDVQHDGIGRPIGVLESFFNSEIVASPTWPLNSHVLRLDVAKEPPVLEGLREGTLNCVSFDAFTFNRKVRLPVAEAKALLAGRQLATEPVGDAAWAHVLASRGLGVAKRCQPLGSGLCLVHRQAGPPVLGSWKAADQVLELSPAGGAWLDLALALGQQPTLDVSQRAFLDEVPVGNGGPVDYGTWDSAAVEQRLREITGLGSTTLADLAAIPPNIYAITAEDGRRFLPHHTILPDGRTALSAQGVTASLNQLDTVPAELRAKAREHLQAHLAELQAAPRQQVLVGALPGGADATAIP